MIKMFLTNFKALVKPKEFVDLTYYGGGSTFVYTFLMTIIITMLCITVPFTQKAPKYSNDIVTALKTVLPEFQYSQGKLNILGKSEQYMTWEDFVFYYNTDVEYLGMTTADGQYYLGHYLTEKQVSELLTKRNVFIASESNLILIENGMLKNNISFSDFLGHLNIGYLDYDTLEQKLPEWIKTLALYGGILFCVLYLIYMYVFSFIIAIFALIVNLIVGARYPFGHLYKLVLFIQIPFILVYQILVFAMMKSTLSTSVLVCQGMLFVYIIAALVHKKKTDGAYGMKFSNASQGGYGSNNYGGYNDQNNNYGGNYGGNYNARQYDAMGGSNTGYQANTYGMNQNSGFESNSFGTNPSAGYQTNSYGMNQNGASAFQTPVYKPNEMAQPKVNNGYNPNPAFSASNQETQAVNQYLTPAMMNARPEETKEKDELVERAQHDVYQRNTKVYDKEQLNQMQAKPVARELNVTRDFTQNEQYAAQNLVWKPKVEEEKIMVDEPQFTSQKWQPQAEFDYKGEKEKWNENTKKWDFNQKTTFQQEWNPQKANAKDDDIFGQKNEWQSNQMVWKADSVNSTPLPSQPSEAQQVSNFAPLPQAPTQQTPSQNPSFSQGGQSQANTRPSEPFQWKQTPVWGVKDDSLDEF